MIVLAHPEALLLLAAVPAALLARRLGGRSGLPVPDITPVLAAGRPGLLSRLPGLMRLLGLVAVALALAGPRLSETTVSYEGRGLDIMLALDLSESMAAMDMNVGGRAVTRLEAVADAAARFADERPGDRIGLVAFGSRAYLVVPPTTDRTALRRALGRLTVGAAGRRTAMGDAVALGVSRLARADGLSRVLVVFGDGRSNAGELPPETAALAAAGKRVVIYSVGVGGDAPAPFLVNHPILGQEIVREKAAVDVATLRQLAAATGGAFFRADDTPALARAIDAVAGREKSDMRPVPGRTDTDFTPLAFAVAVCLLVAWTGLVATRYTRLP